MSEALETGWGPDVPVTDTLARSFSFSLADQFTAPAMHMGKGSARTEHYLAADYGVPAGYSNSVVLLQPLRDDTAAAVMAEITALYDGGLCAGGSGTALLWSVPPTPNLRAHGWVPFGHPPLMLRPAGGAPPPVPAELRVERVMDAATLRDFEQTVVDAYPMPDAQHLVPGGLLGPPVLQDDRLVLFVGYVDDVPVATAGTLLGFGISNVSYVATVPSHRGRGYGEAVTWAATLADPTLPAALLASDAGRPVYARMGYLPILRATLWGRPRG